MNINHTHKTIINIAKAVAVVVKQVAAVVAEEKHRPHHHMNNTNVNINDCNNLNVTLGIRTEEIKKLYFNIITI